MSSEIPSWHRYCEEIQLHVEGRIDAKDAARQTATAREILRRLAQQPGLVLADEVGMGKTFVALAVAVSVALSDKRRRPVVVMVPPALKEKWPGDFAVFASMCLDGKLRSRVRAAPAESALELLKYLDAPPDKRPSLIFLTHGAMHRGLADGWVKLAVIQRAIKGRHNTPKLRRALNRCLGGLLRMDWVHRRGGEALWDQLLGTRPQHWHGVLLRHGILKAEADDPVPADIQTAFDLLDKSILQGLYEAIQKIPYKTTATYDERLKSARRDLNAIMQEVWKLCLERLRVRLPLLILDEAHHLKNSDTRLAGLFQSEDSRADAEAVARGSLAGVFERMVFLTATPFQLGHEELCSVLDRFDGIAWASSRAPTISREEFRQQREELRQRLNAAQLSTQNLDAAWGTLREEDLRADGCSFVDSTAWWDALNDGTEITPAASRVRSSFQAASERMKHAEAALRPWVLRHLRDRSYQGITRRAKLPGRAIETDIVEAHEPGLDISSSALLPFLLAARATLCAPDSRPLFAEGLASSYEAFLETRRRNIRGTDSDDETGPVHADAPDDSGRWYLRQLEEALPRDRHASSAAHPKIAATASRVLKLWREGEKVVVFCHYVVTGQVLRQVISRLIRDEIIKGGALKLGCSAEDVIETLDRMGKRFFDSDSPVRRSCDEQLNTLLKAYPELREHSDDLLDICRRYLRTPSFLVRFFPLRSEHLDEDSVRTAFAQPDGSGLTLRAVLTDFFDFLERRCVPAERHEYLRAIQSVQTGSITGHDAYSADETQGEKPESLLPNVRLANGATKSDTRQRLMRTFNSPFFPEILIASSVMAEGVDLHRFCRHVIHHDLCWNPSTLEQRTGRVDRIGAKVEQCRQSIHIYLPYLAETQDEKMYRVVMDRERWFSVVMGEQYKMDTRTTEKLAQRVPVPETLASALAFNLSTFSP